MEPEFETMSVPVLSTTHITESDDSSIQNQKLFNYKNEYGYIIYLGEGEEIKEYNERFIELSVAFRILVLVMRDKGYCWIRLDRDGPMRTELQTFDW
jgi:hypothetical protein